MSQILVMVLSAVVLVGAIALSRLAVRRQGRARHGLATADTDGVYVFTHPRAPTVTPCSSSCAATAASIACA